MIRDIVKTRERSGQGTNSLVKAAENKPSGSKIVYGEGFIFRPSVLTRSEQTSVDRAKWKKAVEERCAIDADAGLDFSPPRAEIA